MNQLDYIKKFTNVVIDSGNIKYIKKYSPKDVTTNPSLILRESKSKHYYPLLMDAISYAKKKGGNLNSYIINANDKLLVNIGREILKIIDGRISIEIDVRLSFSYLDLIIRAKKIISLYNSYGIENNRILIKIAATWEGIQAAKFLEKSGINCNLTLIFSLVQAIACAESNVYLISPFVGRVNDWYIKNFKLNKNSKIDPGVKLVYKIFYFYKKYGYKTFVMGASFRNIDQIISIIGCDAITISPDFVNKLNNLKLKKIKNFIRVNLESKIKKNKLLEKEFRWKFNQNFMAVEKLSEGIRLFLRDQKKIDSFFLKKFKSG